MTHLAFANPTRVGIHGLTRLTVFIREDIDPFGTCGHKRSSFSFKRPFHRNDHERPMYLRNARSIALVERAGMRREAHHRESLWFPGEWADYVVYALLRRESLARARG